MNISIWMYTCLHIHIHAYTYTCTGIVAAAVIIAIIASIVAYWILFRLLALFPRLELLRFDYIYPYIYIYLYPCIYIHLYPYIYIYLYPYIYMHLYPYIYMSVCYTLKCKKKRILKRIFSLFPRLKCTYICIYFYTCIYFYICIRRYINHDECTG
jgi:hypothetical protein